MIVGVDARSLIAQKTGFGYFLQNTMDGILRIDHENEYILFTDRDIVYNSDSLNVHVFRYQDGPLLRKTFFYRWGLAKQIRKAGIKLDVFWGTTHFMPHFLGADVLKVLTIHDFTPYKFPASTTRFNRVVTRLLFPGSVKDSDILVSISKSTEMDIESFAAKGALGKKKVVVYEGGTAAYSDEIRKSTATERISNLDCHPFVLFTGTIEPRKNIRTLIEAAPLLRDTATVVLCGKFGWETDEVRELLMTTDNLIYLGYVSQGERDWLMSHAVCQIQPSLYEGFGLPVVECLQNGGICVVADNSSLREIIELDSLRFRTGDATDLAEKVKGLVNNADILEEASVYCSNRALDFSWDKTAKEYIDLFNFNHLKRIELK